MKSYSDILKRYWGYDDFRGIQREIIESIGAGRDTLGLMPTGGGKSVTFQVPALALEGTCIVVTPLIALMKDQVANLRQRGIRAAAIHSGLSHDELLATLENAVFGAVKFLYVSPERLGSELFQKKLLHIKVCFICVDEAHCISQWGYDFRPSYLEIARIRQLPLDVPILALTATATPEVVDDIQERLGFRERNVFRMSFERKNLAYVVRHTADKEGELVHILDNVGGSAIVYVSSRRHTKEYAELLTKAGHSATFFHAGLDTVEKDRRQQAWKEGSVRIIVATNAFGMGIDKPDVRLVVHADCPSSPEAYFQEAGRAGRDGRKSYAVLLYEAADRAKLEKRIADNFPDKDYIRQVYDHLAYFYQIGVGSGYLATFEFPLDKFCYTYHHFPVVAEAALKTLTRAGYIEYTEEQDCQARVRFDVGRDDLYRLRGNSDAEDRVIVALLRLYTGLFSEFGYIDEALVAQLASLSRPEVYQALVSLSHKRILSFIPQKRTPFIRYTQRREESRHLQFPPHVYDEQKERFARRIHAMIGYVTADNQCRSRMLLKYFGEKDTHDCGQCDVCLANAKKNEVREDARRAILSLLADGRPHPITELQLLPIDYEQTDTALRDLLADEVVVCNEAGHLLLEKGG